MPGEIFVLILVAITMGTGLIAGVTWMILDHLRTRRAGSSDGSLRASELQALLEAAVAQGNADVMAELEALHARLDALDALPALPPARSEAEEPPARLVAASPPERSAATH